MKRAHQVFQRPRLHFLLGLLYNDLLRLNLVSAITAFEAVRVFTATVMALTAAAVVAAVVAAIAVITATAGAMILMSEVLTTIGEAFSAVLAFPRVKASLACRRDFRGHAPVQAHSLHGVVIQQKAHAATSSKTRRPWTMSAA